MKTNLQIVADHYAVSARRDITGMMAEMSPDVAWTEMAGFPCAGTWIGPEQVLSNVFDVLGSEWDNYRGRSSECRYRAHGGALGVSSRRFVRHVGLEWPNRH